MEELRRSKGKRTYVVCNGAVDGFTIGKVYEVFGSGGEYICLVDDEGARCHVVDGQFDLVSDEASKRLNKEADELEARQEEAKEIAEAHEAKEAKKKSKWANFKRNLRNSGDVLALGVILVGADGSLTKTLEYVVKLDWRMFIIGALVTVGFSTMGAGVVNRIAKRYVKEWTK